MNAVKCYEYQIKSYTSSLNKKKTRLKILVEKFHYFNQNNDK